MMTQSASRKKCFPNQTLSNHALPPRDYLSLRFWESI